MPLAMLRPKREGVFVPHAGGVHWALIRADRADRLSPRLCTAKDHPENGNDPLAHSRAGRTIRRSSLIHKSRAPRTADSLAGEAARGAEPAPTPALVRAS